MRSFNPTFSINPTERDFRSEGATPENRNGKAMIIKLDENEFLAAGTTCRFTFNPVGKNEGKAWQYLKVMEGYYENDEFQMIRVLNGDETDWGGPYIGEIPKLLHFKLVAR